jgi:hypothetical protein
MDVFSSFSREAVIEVKSVCSPTLDVKSRTPAPEFARRSDQMAARLDLFLRLFVLSYACS